MAVKTILYPCISVMKTIVSYLLAIALSFSLVSCGDLNISGLATGEALRDRIEAFPIPEIKGLSFNNFNNSSQTALSETAPPILIRKLGQIIDKYHPQVSILEPLPDLILEDTNVIVQLRVEDLPLFKDENFGIGPHLNLILDDQPYREIYSVDEPIVFKNLAPGTHTLRAFAVRPWDESFKNRGGYAETTFHVLTKTKKNNPDPQIPLLTYSLPNGAYGAEPILLDFYLSHLPNTEIVKNSAVEKLPFWRVKATINGESFILDQWQPVYLTGFEIGNNLIQLELLDDEGSSIENTFNKTVRLITYNPENEDSLARIVTGEIDLQQAISIVDQNYEIPLEETIQEVFEEEISTEEVTEENNITQSAELIPKDNITLDKAEVIESEITEIPEANINIEQLEIDDVQTELKQDEAVETIYEGIEASQTETIEQESIKENSVIKNILETNAETFQVEESTTEGETPIVGQAKNGRIRIKIN